MNFLTHGFSSPTKKVVESARSTVKGAINVWESDYPQKLVEGPIEEFFEGEKWSGDLGTRVARYVLELPRAIGEIDI